MKGLKRTHLRESLRKAHFCTPEAKRIAASLMETPNRAAMLRSLIAALFDEDKFLRTCAGSVARYMTEHDKEVFSSYADELIGLLAATPLEDHWSRYYLGLVVGRSAVDQPQRLRAAELMRRLLEDERNAVRCAGIEGFAQIALEEPSLVEEARSILEDARRHGTPAMKARARNMMKLFHKKQKFR